MFNFLKDKLKGVMKSFSKKVEEEAPEEKVEVEKEVEEKVPKKAPKAPAKKKEAPKKKAPKKEESKLPEPKAKKEPKVEKPKVEPAVKPKAKEQEPEKELVKPEPKREPEKSKAEGPRIEPAKPKAKVEPKESAAEKEERKEPPAKQPAKKQELAKAELAVEPKVEEKIEEPKKGWFSRLKDTFAGAKEEAQVPPEPAETQAPEVKEPEKKGFFKRITETITTKKISEDKFDELFWDLELALLENNVAVEVIEKIKTDLKADLVDKPIPRNEVDSTIAHSLKKSIADLFVTPDFDLLKAAEQKKPYVICFVGINGSGKTTTIAKITKYFQDNDKSVVLAAADTFRAAAIDQLQLHADKLGVKLIRQEYGSDPAAVAFDAVKHAKATDKDVVLIDTAGRLHSNINLMDELKKIIRVANPDIKLFIGESITGNDCIEQAQKFNEAVGIDGIVLSKADVDEKGGAAISVSYVTNKPIMFLGVGQEYEDLQKFDKDKLLKSIGF